MTSEVCLMNRLAVVLAADSATTVTSWSNGTKEERYFKGANKIFQLSNYHAIGLMIYDSADVLRVPWEIVAKDFRTHLGDRSFVNVDGYASEFFDFMGRNDRLFPHSSQKSYLLTTATSAALRFLLSISIPENENKDTYVRDRIENAISECLNSPLHPCLPISSESESITLYTDEISSELDQYRDLDDVPVPLDTTRLSNLAVHLIYRDPKSYLSSTGLVFAGYGDHDVFPSIKHFTSYGVIEGCHVHQESEGGSVNHDQPAFLKAFAQTSMCDTFHIGLGQDVYLSIMLALDEGLQALADELMPPGPLDSATLDRLREAKKNSANRIARSVLERAKQEHAEPLRQVLGVLPIDEMAELAETLINLQSLKEKVTKPSETVGGPVDVAVITRTEGFVWIKRKLYFDPALNSRYMQRQARLLSR